MTTTTATITTTMRDRIMAATRPTQLPELREVTNQADRDLWLAKVDGFNAEYGQGPGVLESAAVALWGRHEVDHEAWGSRDAYVAACVTAGRLLQRTPAMEAESEWGACPDKRKGFSSKENYVACRKAELTGRHVRYGNGRIGARIASFTAEDFKRK